MEQEIVVTTDNIIRKRNFWQRERVRWTTLIIVILLNIWYFLEDPNTYSDDEAQGLVYNTMFKHWWPMTGKQYAKVAMLGTLTIGYGLTAYLSWDQIKQYHRLKNSSGV